MEEIGPYKGNVNQRERAGYKGKFKQNGPIEEIGPYKGNVNQRERAGLKAAATRATSKHALPRGPSS